MVGVQEVLDTLMLGDPWEVRPAMGQVLWGGPWSRGDLSTHYA